MSNYITPVGDLQVPAWVFIVLISLGIGCTGALSLGASVFPMWLNILLGVVSMIISGITGFSSQKS